MTESKGKRLRPINALGVMDKRFATVSFAPSRDSGFNRIHWRIVVTDLRRGCLTSLDRYLKQEGTINRAIAIELRKMLSGSRHRSDVRLVAVRHPGSNAGSPGRPKLTAAAADRRDQMILHRALELELQGTKRYLVSAVLSDEFEVSESTIARALKRVRGTPGRVASQAEAQRIKALSELRDSRAPEQSKNGPVF